MYGDDSSKILRHRNPCAPYRINLSKPSCKPLRLVSCSDKARFSTILIIMVKQRSAHNVFVPHSHSDILFSTLLITQSSLSKFKSSKCHPTISANPALMKAVDLIVRGSMQHALLENWVLIYVNFLLLTAAQSSFEDSLKTPKPRKTFSDEPIVTSIQQREGKSSLIQVEDNSSKWPTA